MIEVLIDDRSTWSDYFKCGLHADHALAMEDFHDVSFLRRRFQLEGATLRCAIEATFTRRMSVAQCAYYVRA